MLNLFETMSKEPEIVQESNSKEKDVVEIPAELSVNAPYLLWNDVFKAPKLILAPMVDQSELAFRLLVRKYGAQCTYSPMYHSPNFIRDSRYRKLCLQVLPEEDFPLVIQVRHTYVFLYLCL